MLSKSVLYALQLRTNISSIDWRNLLIFNDLQQWTTWRVHHIHNECLHESLSLCVCPLLSGWWYQLNYAKAISKASENQLEHPAHSSSSWQTNACHTKGNAYFKHGGGGRVVWRSLAVWNMLAVAFVDKGCSDDGVQEACEKEASPVQWKLSYYADCEREREWESGRERGRDGERREGSWPSVNLAGKVS